MKTPTSFLTLMLVFIGGGWFWTRYKEHSALSMQVGHLQEQLAQPVSPPVPENSNRKTTQSALERRPVDWRAVARELRDGGSIVGGMLSTNAHLRALIDAMSVEELWEAFEEITAADLGKAERDALEEIFARSLLQKDTERAFTTFTVQERGEWRWLLGGEFDLWLTRDETVAFAWLQGHAANGGFIPGQMIHMPFFTRIDTAPVLALAILTCVPPWGRLESLRSLDVHRLRSGGQEQWAEISRTILPPEDHLTAIVWPILNWSDGDGSPMTIQEVNEYFTRISATQAEKEACVMALAKDQMRLEDKNGESSFAIFQRWVEKTAPAQLEAASLLIIENLATYTDFPRASELALEQHQQTGNDAFLTSVLDQVDDRSEPDTIRELIAELDDPALQAKYRKELLRKIE